MAKRHKGSNSGLHVETKEGERGPLCRNKAVVRSPSLSFNRDLVSEKILLDRLAGILVDMFLERKRHERKQKESSHILPCLDKGTS
jgi:hypothetical protein